MIDITVKIKGELGLRALTAWVFSKLKKLGGICICILFSCSYFQFPVLEALPQQVDTYTEWEVGIKYKNGSQSKTDSIKEGEGI